MFQYRDHCQYRDSNQQYTILQLMGTGLGSSCGYVHKVIPGSLAANQEPDKHDWDYTFLPRNWSIQLSGLGMAINSLDD